MSKKILNEYVTVLMPTKLVERYAEVSRKCGRNLATTIRNVLTATIDEAEKAGKELYLFNAEEDQFDELAAKADEDPDDGGQAGEADVSEASLDGGAEHPEGASSDTEVHDGGNVDDGASQDGGRPSSRSEDKPRGRKSKKGR